VSLCQVQLGKQASSGRIVYLIPSKQCLFRSYQNTIRQNLLQLDFSIADQQSIGQPNQVGNCGHDGFSSIVAV
jgi:hypothetical protein